MNQHPTQRPVFAGVDESQFGSSKRIAGALLTLVIIELTLATAYIHLSLGGLLFTLNGIGYVGLATAYAVTATVPILRRFGWLAQIGLAGYAALTIGAYLVIGPYFDLGWIAKGIEVAIVGLVIVNLLGAYGDLRGLRRAAIGSMRLSGGPWAAVLAVVVLVLAASACGTSRAESQPSLDPADADVTITSRDMAFDQETLTVAAGSTWRLQLVNQDSAPHNVAIYTDESASESLFIGELITDATIVYDIPALEPGTYFFRCDLHPEMKGTLIVEG